MTNVALNESLCCIGFVLESDKFDMSFQAGSITAICVSLGKPCQLQLLYPENKDTHRAAVGNKSSTFKRVQYLAQSEQ